MSGGVEKTKFSGAFVIIANISTVSFRFVAEQSAEIGFFLFKMSFSFLFLP